LASVKAVAPPKSDELPLSTKRKRLAYVLLAPAVIAAAVLTLYPTVYMVYISFHRWSIMPTLPRPFVGFAQYAEILKGPQFWNSLRVTVIFVIAAVSIEMTLGFFAALLLHGEHRGVRLFRVPFLIPAIIAPVVVGLIWRFMFSADLGILNYFTGLLGIPKIPWLGHPTYALFSIILVDVWQWTPFTTLILLAGLDSLPNEPFEAAYVEGATRWQTIRHLTIPMLLPVFTVALMFRTLDAFKMFDIVYIVTRGGPANATYVLSYNIWRKGFLENRLGAAAALSVIMVILATMISQVFIRMLYKQAKS
jgi:multiple sugar transport system permease protein